MRNFAATIYPTMTRRKKKARRRSAQWLTVMIVAIGAIWFASAIRARDEANATSEETGTERTYRPVATASGEEMLAVATNPQLPGIDVAYEGMILSFNPMMHVPNWVSWELTADETSGHAERYDKFMTDESVEGCAEPWDYSYSGYDRGHMAPAGDMKWSDEAMRHTFYLTNICPQMKSLNTGAWKRLEEKCRQWAKADSAILIVCGPVLTDSIREYIGDSRVAVPERFFKVVLSPYTNPVRGIGFIMENGRVEGGMQRAAVSINEVERVTGHDFFAWLPDDIEKKAEAECDFPYWSNIRPKK